MILAWYLVVTIAGYASKELGIVYGIGSNIYILTSFFAEGVSKAIAAIVANMIGQRAIKQIAIVFRKFMILVAVFMCMLAIPMMIFPELAMSTLSILGEHIMGIHDQIVRVLKYSLIMLSLESIEYVVWGILLAVGDTRYPTIISQSCIWSIIVIPMLILYHLDKLSSVDTIYMLMISSYAISFGLFYRRYKNLKWYRRLS
jgi:Na+-driven multidrug efflux pump